MLKRSIFALGTALVFAQSSFAAVQSTTVPYNQFRSRLQIKQGETYLSFVEREVKPALDSYEDTILNSKSLKAKQYAQLQPELIGQGAGVAIAINPRNYIFNVGYLNGSQPNDIKSGRSYGVGPAGRQSDPSDLMYLQELEAFLKAEPQSVGTFVETIMRVLTYCDTSGWSHLSPQGQTVATDFLAIYTAELDRHLMVKLDPRKHPWEIDLAAATFVSVFSANSGLIMQNGQLVRGGLQSWWAKGQQGSGIGETRRDRIALQRLIAREEANSPQTKELLSLIGGRTDGDVIQGVLEYLSSPSAPAAFTVQQAQALTESLRDYLLQVQSHSDAIAKLR